MVIGSSLNEVYEKYIEEGFNDFVAMIVIRVLLRVSILGSASVKSCVKRSYDDTWKEERVTDQLRDG